MRDEARPRRRLRLHPFAFVLLFALASARAFALDVPPAPTQWVTDQGGILQPDQLSALNQKLSNFEQQSGAQFIIYIFPSLEGDPVEDFTIRCVQKWKVGQKKYDNGLVLFVFVKDRKIRIEVGYGLEGTVTDAFSSDVIRNYIAPHFQQGDWYGGLNAASDAIIAKIRGGEAPVPPANPRGAQQPTGGNGGRFGSVIPLLILFVLLFFILPMLVRGGGCGGCFWPMLFMGGGRGGGTTFGGGGGFGGFGGGGGFSGGGGSFGGGGATGGW